MACCPTGRRPDSVLSAVSMLDPVRQGIEDKHKHLSRPVDRPFQSIELRAGKLQLRAPKFDN